MAASRWFNTSPPLLVSLGILAAIFLLGFAWLSGLSLVLAGALWAGAIVGVLHASDQLRSLDRYPSVSRLLAVYAPRLEVARVAQPTSPVIDTLYLAYHSGSRRVPVCWT
jgi:hypothetical protein